MDIKEPEKQIFHGTVIGLGFASAMIGGLLGIGADALYDSDTQVGTGRIPGFVFGALVGVVYTYLMFSIYTKGVTRKQFINYAGLIGIATGVVCSTLVHATLMILNATSYFYPMLVGAVFGIVAGFIVGAIAGRILWNSFTKKYHNIDSNNPNQQTDSTEQ